MAPSLMLDTGWGAEKSSRQIGSQVINCSDQGEKERFYQVGTVQDCPHVGARHWRKSHCLGTLGGDVRQVTTLLTPSGVNQANLRPPVGILKKGKSLGVFRSCHMPAPGFQAL